MILCIDIGNSNIVMGLAKEKEILNTLRIKTEKDMTPDEIGMILSFFLKEQQIKDIIISSVVPPLNNNFCEACLKYYNKEPIIINPDMETGISLSYEELENLGADRIANAAGAYDKYKKGIIVIDFGTATTFDYVSKEGVYMGGAISPGIRVSSDALFKMTNKLPRIEKFYLPERVLAKRTIESINAGIILGYASLVDGMVKKIKDEIKDKECMVVATGGLAHLMKDAANTIDIVDNLLTLYGLIVIYRLNKKECL